MTGGVEAGRYRRWDEPTEAQKRAGNYSKPLLRVAGLDIRVENLAGSLRHGEGPSGPWQTRMVYPYGYIVGSMGADGDPVDVYVGSNPDPEFVYIVHQRQAGAWSEYDEDKVMLGFESEDDARRAYLLHYDDPRFLGPISVLPLAEFVEKVRETADEPGEIRPDYRDRYRRLLERRTDGSQEAMAAEDARLSLLRSDSALVDLGPLSSCCADHALEMLAKAYTEDQHNVWARHENPWIAHLIELFTQRGLLRIDTVRTELAAWLAGQHAKPGKAPVPPGMMPQWSPDDLALVRLYLENLPPAAWGLEEYDYLVSYLIQRYLPAGEMQTEAEWLVARSYLLGKAQVYLGDPKPGVADAVMGALPLTVAGASQALAASEQAILTYGRIHAAENVVALGESARHALKRVLVDHMAKKTGGDPEATPSRLQQRLFDTFDSWNRDWRRIALTEAGEMANQGVIASLPVGSRVKRVEMYDGACRFCRALDGRVFGVTTADDPNRDGATQIWPGKTNVGRSAAPRKKTAEGLVLREPEEMWWPAAGTQHPHCRGRWERLEAEGLGADDDFTRWFRQAVGIRDGLALTEWSPRHAAALV